MKRTHYKCHIYQDDAGEWRWRLKSSNGRIVADSGEGYTKKQGAAKAWNQIHYSLHAIYWVDVVYDN